MRACACVSVLTSASIYKLILFANSEFEGPTGVKSSEAPSEATLNASKSPADALSARLFAPHRFPQVNGESFFPPQSSFRPILPLVTSSARRLRGGAGGCFRCHILSRSQLSPQIRCLIRCVILSLSLRLNPLIDPKCNLVGSERMEIKSWRKM